MIAARKAQQIEIAERPFGSGFLSFLKSSKPEIVNIFFAFVCVLLAYQIHKMRYGIRMMLAEKEEKDAEIDRLRGLLASLSEGDDVQNTNDDSFSTRLAQKCADVVKDMFEQSEKRVGYSWILGKKLANGDALELEKLIDELQPVILTNVQSVVGDAAYTAEQLKERHVAALKAENECKSSLALDTNQPSQGASENQMGDLMQILEEVHSQDLTDEQKAKGDDNSTGTTVRRTRYAI
jgi:hypothetical protein